MLLLVVDLAQIQHCAAYDEALKDVDLLLMPTLPLGAMHTSLAILPRRFRQACREGSPVGMMLIGCRQEVTSIDHRIGVRKQLCRHINTLRFSGLQVANDFVPRHRCAGIPAAPWPKQWVKG